MIDCYFYGITTTPRERCAAARYWEGVREYTAGIRDVSDLEEEHRYRVKHMATHTCATSTDVPCTTEAWPQ